MNYTLNYNNYSIKIELYHTSTYGEFGIKGYNYYIHKEYQSISEFGEPTTDEIDEVQRIKYKTVKALALSDENLMDQVMNETEGMYLFAAETYNGWPIEDIAEDYDLPLLQVKKETMAFIIASILLVLDPTI